MNRFWPLAAFVVSALVGSTGCTAQLACATVNGCRSGFECLANRCVPSGGEPVSPHGDRLLFFPSSVEIWPLKSGELLDRGNAELQATVTLGDSNYERALSLEFGRVPPAFNIEAAFLLLEPALSAAPSEKDLGIRVQRLNRRLAEAALSVVKPNIADLVVAPNAHGVARAGGTGPLRIDVTELARYFQAYPTSYPGWVVRAKDDRWVGATFRTGLDGGMPALEVYGVSKSSPSRPGVSAKTSANSAFAGSRVFGKHEDPR